MEIIYICLPKWTESNIFRVVHAVAEVVYVLKCLLLRRGLAFASFQRLGARTAVVCYAHSSITAYLSRVRVVCCGRYMIHEPSPAGAAMAAILAAAAAAVAAAVVAAVAADALPPPLPLGQPILPGLAGFQARLAAAAHWRWRCRRRGRCRGRPPSPPAANALGPAMAAAAAFAAGAPALLACCVVSYCMRSRPHVCPAARLLAAWLGSGGRDGCHCGLPRPYLPLPPSAAATLGRHH